jgi:outer membrane protein assembly factor BamB
MLREILLWGGCSQRRATRATRASHAHLRGNFSCAKSGASPYSVIMRLPFMFSRFLLLSLATGPLLPANGHAQDWPIFRGPTGDGHSDVKNLPTTWSKTENVRWHVELPGKGWSSPILVAGKLYFTAAITPHGNGDDPRTDKTLNTLCLDAATGKTLWNVEVFKQDGSKSPDSIHSKNSHASPTPIHQDGKLYVHFGHQGTACLDLNGKPIWENRQLTYQPQHGAGSTPVLVEGHLIFTCDGREEQHVAALRIKDGTVAWKWKRPTRAQRKFSFATPVCITVAGKKQVISPGADMVNALDPATGKEIWRCDYEGYSVVPKPVYGNGLVYICSSFDTPDVLAIDPTGHGDVTSKNIKWQVGPNKRPPCTPSMILDGENLFWVSDGGIASCANALTGDILWNERIGKSYSASPILADSKIYLQDENGLCTIIQASREFKKLGENKLDGERTLASFAATDGTLFIRTETGMYSIGQP